MTQKKKEVEHISPEIGDIILSCGHFQKPFMPNKILFGQATICEVCDQTRHTIGQIAKIIKDDTNTSELVIVSKIIKPALRRTIGNGN